MGLARYTLSPSLRCDHKRATEAATTPPCGTRNWHFDRFIRFIPPQRKSLIAWKVAHWDLTLEISQLDSLHRVGEDRLQPSDCLVKSWPLPVDCVHSEPMVRHLPNPAKSTLPIVPHSHALSSGLVTRASGGKLEPYTGVAAITTSCKGSLAGGGACLCIAFRFGAGGGDMTLGQHESCTDDSSCEFATSEVYRCGKRWECMLNFVGIGPWTVVMLDQAPCSGLS